MKINLGCGNFPLSGYVNHDIIKHRPEIDIAFDLDNKNWSDNLFSLKMRVVGTPNPLYIDLFEEIRAYDVIEHLNNPLEFINQCWLSLKDGGILDLKACGFGNENFWIDITHKKPFHIKSFDYLDPTIDLGKELSFYTDKKWQILDKHYDRHGNVLVKLKKLD